MRLLFLLVMVLLSLTAAAQRPEECYDDSDTLLIVGGSLINSSNYMIDRSKLLANDTVFVNMPGLTVENFTVSAFALGQKLSVTNAGNVLSEDVLEQLTNKESIFKFFYLKDVILRTADGRKFAPSTKTIKITFTN
ncbi:MAG: hypothetical protein J6T98_07925 [Salinivirgaceae bacterium]|nr:hypothetical protein [Salinivirgaceae bacterium]